ncbi:MAG: RNA-directed DNA polymerase, partial [Planctomycetes bacterium]|nr:RNA-directed DNA polymerase [Planctomycetota bacterium]
PSDNPPSERGLKAEQREAARRKEAREEAQREARLARVEARREREAALRQRLAREVLYAGEGVSATVAHAASDVARLEAGGLPVAHSALDLAHLLGLDLPALRWLTFHREVARSTHYRQYQVAKRRGGFRTISAPRPKLKAALRAVRERILGRLAVSPQAQAFVPGRSTLTNARPHLRAAVVVKLDVVDFFGSFSFPRVRGWFRARGYSGMVSTLLALLTTEAPRVEVELDGARYYVATGPRVLPQGAPTSPELTNLLALRLDRRLAAYGAKHGWTYTRYADDLTFSRADEPEGCVSRLLGTAEAILRDEGLRLNHDKQCVTRRGRQQRVTGIVVNEVAGLPRRDLRTFRAAVHRVTRDGFKDVHERQRMLGYASYVRMVKPALGERWLEALREVRS